MWTTPSEAAQKTCHITLVNTTPSKCIGPACMAWRWSTPPTALPSSNPPPPTVLGCCGLATIPAGYKQS